MENKILESLYHIRKAQILQFYRLDPAKSMFPVSAVYALRRDCFPVFLQDYTEFEMYDEVFRVKKDYINQVVDFIVSEYDKGMYHSYYDLETRFGGKECRSSLMTTIRYAFLAGVLDDEFFWKKLVENNGSPIEAKNLNRPFDESEFLL